MPDSLLHNIDSLRLVNLDSLQIIDSLQRADSLAVADSLKAIVAAPTGMEGVLHPSFPANESWVFIVIAFLFFLLVSGIIQSAGVFLENFKSFFSRKNPINLTADFTGNLAQFQLFINIFTICVFALTAYEFVFLPPEKFKFITFAIFCGLFLGFYLLKQLLFEIVGNTFFDSKVTRNYKNLYFSLLNVLAVAIFPILLLFTFQPISWQKPLMIVALIFVGIFYITLIIKLFQIFFTKPLALFYIILYLCTLEILPILILIRIGKIFI